MLSSAFGTSRLHEPELEENCWVREESAKVGHRSSYCADEFKLPRLVCRRTPDNSQAESRPLCPPVMWRWIVATLESGLFFCGMPVENLRRKSGEKGAHMGWVSNEFENCHQGKVKRDSHCPPWLTFCSIVDEGESTCGKEHQSRTTWAGRIESVIREKKHYDHQKRAVKWIGQRWIFDCVMVERGEEKGGVSLLGNEAKRWLPRKSEDTLVRAVD